LFLIIYIKSLGGYNLFARLFVRVSLILRICEKEKKLENK